MTLRLHELQLFRVIFYSQLSQQGRKSVLDRTSGRYEFVRIVNEEGFDPPESYDKSEAPRDVWKLPQEATGA